MYSVTENFKTNMKADARELQARVILNETTLTEEDDLYSLKIKAMGALCRTTMRGVEIQYTGGHQLLGNWVQIGIGNEDEFIDFGSFLITESKTEKGSNIITSIGYDKMYSALQPYTTEREFPCSLLELLQDICTTLNITLATTEFTNDDLVVSENIYDGLDFTFR